MIENHKISLIQYVLRAKRVMFTFWVNKSSLKMPKISWFGEFWKSKACGQIVLPILIGQKLVENVKVRKFKCDILSNFQTMWGLPFLLIHQWTLFPGTLLGIFKRRPRIHTSTLSTWKLLPCFVVQLAKLWVKSWASSIVCSKLMNFFFCWNEDCTLNALYLTWFNFR